MTWLDAIILGVVEGVTEYIPVSSTGHLLLTATLLGLRETEESRRAVDAFDIVIQGGAILAVAQVYFSRIRAMVRAVFAACGLVRFGPDHRRDIVLARNLFIALVPTVLLGPLLEDRIDARLMHPVPVLAALLLGGIAMILLDKTVRARSALAQGRGHSPDTLGPVRSLAIGLAQVASMWPGTSRSMATILGGLGVGMRVKEAAEFSFLLALPTLGGACLWKLRGIVGDGQSVELLGGWWVIAVGVVASYITALLSVRWLLAYLSRGGIAIFGWWRVVIAVILGAAIALGWVAL